MKKQKTTLTRKDQRAIRAAARAGVAAFKASRHTDPTRRFADAMTALLRKIFKPVKRNNERKTA